MQPDSIMRARVGRREREEETWREGSDVTAGEERREQGRGKNKGKEESGKREYRGEKGEG